MTPRDNLAHAGLFLAALLLLSWSLVRPAALSVDVGQWGDHTYLSGIYDIEASSTEDYRWTDGAARLTLPNLSPAYRLLELRGHGWRPDGQQTPTLRLGIGDRAIGAVPLPRAVRVYRVLLPPQTGALSQVALDSETYAPPGDPRTIGVALDTIELRRVGLALPSWWQLAGQALLLALLAVFSWALRLTRGWGLALSATLLGGVTALNLGAPLVVGQGLAGWLGVCLALVVAVVAAGRRQGTLPQRREAHNGHKAAHHAMSGIGHWQLDRATLALLAIGLLIRLLGSVHPLFNSHDVDVHMRWLDTVAQGQWYLYSTPSEARNRLVFNPPTAYALLLPLTLLTDTRLTVQVGTALLDWSGCVALLLIAGELGLGARARRLALGLYLFLPITATILWWGFAANIIAQAGWLWLLWLLLRVRRAPQRGWLWLSAACAGAALTSHIGAALLAAVALTAIIVGWLLMAADARARRGALLLGGALAAMAAAVLLLYVSAAVAPLLGNADNSLLASADGSGFISRATPLSRLGILAAAAPRAYTLPLLMLAPLGMLALWRQTNPAGRVVVFGWGGACLLFWAIHMQAGMLTRYLYFAGPLLCLGGGALLAALALRGRAGAVLAAALPLLVSVSGTLLWLGGALLRIKPSGLPLSH